MKLPPIQEIRVIHGRTPCLPFAFGSSPRMHLHVSGTSLAFVVRFISRVIDIHKCVVVFAVKQIPLGDLLTVLLKDPMSQCVGNSDNPNTVPNEFIVDISKLPGENKEVLYGHAPT